MKLVIVESPTKVKSISKYLGPEYKVDASVGHVRDLPQPSDIPASQKEKFGKFSVDVDHGFTPYYAVSKVTRGRSKHDIIKTLKAELADADELILATDPDREGEAIAWHLQEVLKPKVPVRRVAFNEVTEQSVQNAFKNARDIDSNLVDAQEARRIVDRLYGYSVSPILWRKVAKGLSAGRVQSPATRLIVEREYERFAFKVAQYYGIKAQLQKDGIEFTAELHTIDGKEIATGSDFNDAGVTKNDHIVLDGVVANNLIESLANASWRIDNVETTQYKRSARAPFTTSTLQQAAGNTLAFSSANTMRIAQSLYENGLITYMRTDSAQLSDEGMQGAKQAVIEGYGSGSYYFKQYTTTAKHSQEAHEAIRPAGAIFQKPESLANLKEDELRLYTLIYKRTVSSQMIDCFGETTTFATKASNCGFRTSGTVITQKGWTECYDYSDDERIVLPKVAAGDSVEKIDLQAEEHSTKPPARYTEASLVRKMEELGIGRPSTYAAIISTIIARGYAIKKGQALVPGWHAFSVVRLLQQNLEYLIDYDFTAKMEGDLDDIADGKLPRVQFLNDFYFGSDNTNAGLKKLSDASILETIDTQELNTFNISDNGRYHLRISRYGSVSVEDTQGGKDADGNFPRAYIPQDISPDEITDAFAKDLIENSEHVLENRTLGIDPATGYDVTAQIGPYGPYVKTKRDMNVKPKPKSEFKNAGLLKSQTIETITLEDALKLLSLPRILGIDPSDGQEISAANGRFGPFLKKGADFRSLDSEDKIFETSLEEAIEIYSHAKVYKRGPRKKRA